MTGPVFLDAERVARALAPDAAVDAVRAALADGLDPALDAARIQVPLASGEFLLMPSGSVTAAGVKVLTVAPANPAAGLPRIQGLYLLADAATLSPRAVLDGAALTTLRTPAVSFAAVRELLLAPLEVPSPVGGPEFEHSSGRWGLQRGADAGGRAQGAGAAASAPLDVVVFGAGPQAEAHLATLRAVLDGRRALGTVTRVARRPRRGAVVAGSAEASTALAAAGLIVCATTAREPLFDGSLVRADAVVIAVGSHEPDARELDAALMGRASVIVEDPATALREAGDVVLAVAEGFLDPASLIPMRDVVRGGARLPAGLPVVFKSTGMSWEDLAIAEAVANAAGA
ncbi:ornithine cyclodeaminase family protein [Agromyces archimandritae]|uniref:Ornithine cyclodeaminase family protein n=1 Tax=Agromyces archimandritae TaxID=2781962 RepID=A0A975FKC5_9MICO|nr:ornithine cyclodeaminase family protein [Agromyces archimandritae]QTX03569.1 ornithine cyclodeaminase family protein [Agromyces archimandritae]